MKISSDREDVHFKKCSFCKRWMELEKTDIRMHYFPIDIDPRVGCEKFYWFRCLCGKGSVANDVDLLWVEQFPDVSFNYDLYNSNDCEQ